MTACTFVIPDAAWACLMVLTTPRWLHAVRMTRPRPLRLSAMASSCWNWSGMIAFVSSWQLVGIAADAVLDADLHHTRREHLLKTPQSNLSCGEGVGSHQRGPIRISHSQIGQLQSVA